MEILNLTPHPVNIINGEGVMTATFPVAGPAPRLAELVESLPADCFQDHRGRGHRP